MGRIKLAESWSAQELGICEVFVCLRDVNGPHAPAAMTLHAKGFEAETPALAPIQIVEPQGPLDLESVREDGLPPWRVIVPGGLVRRLRSRVLIDDKDGGAPGRLVARIQPEFLAPAVAAEIAERMHWPITQLQMAECIARACAVGQWSAPVVNLSTFSVRLQFEGERLRLIRIGRDGAAGSDLKAAERVRYVRDCEAGRFSISTPVEVFEGSVEPERAVQILAEVGRVIGVRPYEDSPCFEDAPSPTRARCAAMRG